MLTAAIPVILFVLLSVAENGSCLDCSGAWKICSKNSDGNCETCVRSHPCCSWCIDLTFTHKRCNTKAYLLDMKCSANGIYSGGNSNVANVGEINMPFANADETKNQPAVQIRPQKLNVQLRLNDPITIQLQYKPALDYPLDLYYLMDLTYSMREDLQTMIKLGSEMADFLQTLAKTYQIGFGYYMDKVVMPFSFNNKELLENPCKKGGTTCERGYDFIHALNFTTKVKEFIEKLHSSKITANLDDLEGGTDAIMQIVVCKEHMKWRTYSRKIIVIATDGRLHFAGDGILAGITEKNPGICLIDTDGSYSGALEYDYPSLGEIYRKLLEYKVNLLFAAKQGVYLYYDQLQKTIPEVSFVGQLEEKSENIFQLIQKSYMKVVSNARFEAKAPDGIKVTFRSTCNRRDVRMDVTNSCDNIKMGEVYTFNVTIELEEVPVNNSTTIIIEEMNLAENLEINVEYVGIHCQCDNNRTQTHCGKHGNFECGKCICDEGWAGHACEKECSKSPCKFVNETYTSTTCYSHGECDRSTCQCICDNDYMGPYCEYDQCKRHRGKICSNNGECERGTCICNNNYEGDDCSCYVGKEKCEVPGKELCSGGGICDCGQCRCHEGYTGERCEYCPSCARICKAYDDCVISVAQNMSTDACSTNETRYITVRATEKIEAKCLARYLNDANTMCEIDYTYFVKGDKIRLEYSDPYCPPPFYASTPAISAFVAIFLVGVTALVIWRINATYRDKMAYKKFQEEVEQSGFGNELNPIYKSPVRKYFNPIRNDEIFETEFRTS